MRHVRGFVQESLFDVTPRSERRYYRQMLDALTRSDFGVAALPAELAVSKLFGTVWAAQPVPRDGAQEEAFGLGLVEYAGLRPSPTAVALLQTISVIAPVREVREAAGPAIAELLGRGVPTPQWTPPVGSAEAGSCWSYEDVYGDRTVIVCEFTYGSGRHGLLLDIDHTMEGAAVRLALRDDVDATVQDLRHQATASNGLAALHQLDPSTARALQVRALARTDLVPGVETWPGYADLRALALARLDRLAGGPDLLALAVEERPLDAAGRAGAIAEFLGSPEASTLPDLSVAVQVAESIVAFGGPVLRVSPALWEAYLHEWWPSRGGPEGWVAVVRAWSAWAGRRMALPELARAQLAAELDELLAPFTG